jgi:pimeloyl-ACP methyl ester carboxylesterase
MGNFCARVLSSRGFALWMLFAFSAPFISAQQVSPVPQQSSTASSGKTESPQFHEDWNTITLETSSDLRMLPPVSVKGDTPQNSFTRELYQLQWRPGDPLDLYVVRPKGVVKPPVVLYLYTYPQDTDRFKDDHWCATVTNGGYAAVGFVSALTGHRYHDRPMKEWFVSELQEALATSTHDVQMILNFLADRKDLDLDRVGMFGQGSGGAIAILASAADPRIKVVDLLEPWGDWPVWLAKSKAVPEPERAAYLTPEFLARVAPLDPVYWLPKMKAERIRIQDVRRDPVNPDAAQERLEAAAPDRAEIEQFGDSRAFYPAAAGGKIFDWMKQQFQPDAKTVADNSSRIRFHPPMGDPPPSLPVSK